MSHRSSRLCAYLYFMVHVPLFIIKNDPRIRSTAMGTWTTPRSQVIPPFLSLFTRFRPYLAHFPPVFSGFFARFHRLDEAVPTSPKPEPRAKKQPARVPRAENSPLRSTPQVLTKGSPGSRPFLARTSPFSARLGKTDGPQQPRAASSEHVVCARL